MNTMCTTSNITTTYGRKKMNDIDALINGFKEFHTDYIEDREGVFSGLAEYGPHSKILMIACCDSRVDPAIITNSKAGDLMVVRNMGNLVPTYNQELGFNETQAAIEFAVSYLKVNNIIIMGHSRCAGIRSLLTRLVDDADPILSLDKWMSIAEPAARTVLKEMAGDDMDDQSCACSRKALSYSLDNLSQYPSVQEGVQKNELSIHGWYFNLANGELESYNREQQIFSSIF